MHTNRPRTLAMVLLSVAAVVGPASGAAGSTADVDRPFCADRPGLATPACTMAPGRFMVEFGSLDWVTDRADGVKTEGYSLADLRIRYGIAAATELQVDVPAYRGVLTRDLASGLRQHLHGMGNLTVALRHNFANPGGEGLAWGLMPWVSLPTGRRTVNDAVYSAGLSLPLTREFAEGLSFAWTPEVDWLPNEVGGGHHAVVATVMGLGGALSESVGMALEISATRDGQSTAGRTRYLGGVSAGWQVSADVQLDAGVNLGLNRAAPDTEIYTGVALRF